jgi:serine/threonine-protein kinase
VGQKLGAFEVSTLLGVGGMGEVYRARDTKLGRDVAIKILPQEFAHDHDRLARFQREARLLAALNHPNIAHIHELQETDGVQYLVMELVGGQTLADRLKQGPLPVDEALKLFIQIAEGLDAAHLQGVIHRDLKPANIKITDDGKVRLLDFGLAKATDPALSTNRDAATSPWNAHADGKSREGQILGTPAYMSPEQARGKPVDKRTDIWAFGCCLYEALTTKRPFTGETGSDTLAAILKSEPSWEELSTSTPPRLRELIELCLAKEPRDRVHDIGDARIELERIASDPSAASGRVTGIRRSRLMTAILAMLLLTSLGLGAVCWSLLRSLPPATTGTVNRGPVVRSLIVLPSGPATTIAAASEISALYQGPRVAISPDGSNLVYVGGQDDDTRLYLRPMADAVTRELPGTARATSPFFSPNGQSVGFHAGGQLKKVALGGSRPVDICPVRYLRGASWGRDGMIYFADSRVDSRPMNSGLKRVRETGGEPEQITRAAADSNILGHGFPCALPDGNTVVFSLQHTLGRESSLAALSLTTGEWEEILPRAQLAQYVSDGHLLFYDQGWFSVIRYDLQRRKTIGNRESVFESGLLPSVSREGCLVHGPPSSWVSSDGLPAVRGLVWVDRHDGTEPLKLPEQRYQDVRLSPLAERAAVEVGGERASDIWIHDLQGTAVPINLTLGVDVSNMAPVWTPDGNRVVFSRRNRLDTTSWTNLYIAPADGSAPPARLTNIDRFQSPGSVNRNGILALIQRGNQDSDIYTLALGDGGEAQPLLNSAANETSPVFSQDGEWLAYMSDELGAGPEVFVIPYPRPATSRPYQISEHGGMRPVWSPRGDEIFFRDVQALYAARIETKPAFRVLRVERVLDYRSPTPLRRGYDVSPDGQRFVFLGRTEAEAAIQPIDQLTVVQNWFEELKRLVPNEGGEEK